MPLDRFEVSLIPGEPARFLRVIGDRQQRRVGRCENCILPQATLRPYASGQQWHLQCWSWTWKNRMKLYAISDLHLDYAINREALQALPSHPEDWLILGGDLGHTEDELHFALRLLTQRFQRLFWVPGNL